MKIDLQVFRANAFASPSFSTSYSCKVRPISKISHVNSDHYNHCSAHSFSFLKPNKNVYRISPETEHSFKLVQHATKNMGKYVDMRYQSMQNFWERNVFKCSSRRLFLNILKSDKIAQRILLVDWNCIQLGSVNQNPNYIPNKHSSPLPSFQPLESRAVSWNQPSDRKQI